MSRGGQRAGSAATRSDGTSTPGGARPRTVRASDEEWLRWQALARLHGVTVSDAVRMAMAEAIERADG